MVNLSDKTCVEISLSWWVPGGEQQSSLIATGKKLFCYNLSFLRVDFAPLCHLQIGFGGIGVQVDSNQFSVDSLIASVVAFRLQSNSPLQHSHSSSIAIFLPQRATLPASEISRNLNTGAISRGQMSFINYS